MSEFDDLYDAKYPTGHPIHGPLVPADLSKLKHKYAGPDCSFCSWRKENLIDLGWERLLESDDDKTYGRGSLYGVELTSSQVNDPYKQL